MSSNPQMNPLPYDAGSKREAGSTPNVATPAHTHGHGWIVFAAIMLFLGGVFNVIDGLVGLANSRFYVAGAVYVLSDLRTWSRIVLAFGVLAIVAASAVVARQPWGRWFGIIVAGVNAIAQMLFLSAFPWWSLLIIAIDVLVIFGLATYGGTEAYQEVY